MVQCCHEGRDEEGASRRLRRFDQGNVQRARRENARHRRHQTISCVRGLCCWRGFFSGEGKKDQLPDAFIFERLKAEASKEEPLIIVSNDGDFDNPVESGKHISLVKSLPELFKTLGLEIEAPEIDEFFQQHKAELVEAADRELADWGLIADVEDAEIDETTVTDIEAPSLTAFKPIKEGDPYLVVGRLTLKANVSYTHPNWDEAMYDSEDKRLIPFEDVSGQRKSALM